MITTFRVAYPGSRSFLGHIFRPVVEPRTYLRTIHLFAMFPLGIAYFVSLVTLLSVGGSLIWTFPGALIVLVTIFGSRLVGDFESVLIGNVSGEKIKRPPWRTEGAEGWRSRLWIRLIDPTTWTGIVYLFVQFPIGIGAFVTLVVTLAISGSFIAAPLIIRITGDPVKMDFAGWSLVLDTPAEAIWLMPIGLLMLLLTVHIVTVFSVLHAAWARFMLGSRAKPAQTPSTPPELPPLAERESTSRPNTPPVPDSGSRLRPFSPVSPQDTQPQNERPLSEPVPAAGPDVVTPAMSEARSLAASLTQREHEVLLLLARGMTNAEIAETCVISQGTVKTHVKRILAKLKLNDRTQVVVFAYETGLVTPEPAITPGPLRMRDVH